MKGRESWVLNKMAMRPKHGSLGLVILSHISVFDIFSHVLPACFATYSISPWCNGMSDSTGSVMKV